MTQTPPERTGFVFFYFSIGLCTPNRSLCIFLQRAALYVLAEVVYTLPGTIHAHAATATTLSVLLRQQREWRILGCSQEDEDIRHKMGYIPRFVVYFFAFFYEQHTYTTVRQILHRVDVFCPAHRDALKLYLSVYCPEGGYLSGIDHPHARRVYLATCEQLERI